MATRFAQQFIRTGAPSLMRQFGESVTYYAGGTGGGLEIQAIVERNVAIQSEIDGQVAQAIIVRVLNSSTLGISANTMDSGRDTISLPLEVGGTAEVRQITRKIDAANGFVRLQVR